MRRFSGVARDSAGNALSDPTVAVYVASSTATTATIYSDNSFTALANTFTGNTDGTFRFYARDGRYNIVLTKSGFTFSTVVEYDDVFYDPFAVITGAVTTATTTSFNNYAPTNGAGGRVWRLSSTGNIQITGLDSAGSTASGKWLSIVNLSSSTGEISLMDQNAGSTASNRIITGTTGTVTLAPDGTSTLFYDVTATRWRLINKHPTT